MASSGLTYTILDLQIIRGAHFGPITIACYDGNNPFDLTGYEAFAQARRFAPDGLARVEDIAFDLGATIVGNTNVIQLELLSVVTQALTKGVFSWDIFLDDGRGEPEPLPIKGSCGVDTPATQSMFT